MWRIFRSFPRVAASRITSFSRDFNFEIPVDFIDFYTANTEELALIKKPVLHVELGYQSGTEGQFVYPGDLETLDPFHIAYATLPRQILPIAVLAGDDLLCICSEGRTLSLVTWHHDADVDDTTSATRKIVPPEFSLELKGHENIWKNLIIVLEPGINDFEIVKSDYSSWMDELQYLDSGQTILSEYIKIFGVDKKDDLGWSLLMSACGSGAVDFVELLLNLSARDVRAPFVAVQHRRDRETAKKMLEIFDRYGWVDWHATHPQLHKNMLELSFSAFTLYHINRGYHLNDPVILWLKEKGVVMNESSSYKKWDF